MRLNAALYLAFGAALTAGACARSSRIPPSADQATVLKVENQGFPDMNVYVVPEGSGRIRLGTVTGNTTAYFNLPRYVVNGIRTLRFQALPLATTRGEITQSIPVTPGDTVVLTIPPG